MDSLTSGSDNSAIPTKGRTLYAKGAVRQVWNRGDIPGSGMMFEAADDAEVRAHLATLPLVKAGMMDIAAIVSLKPYPGFGPKH
ncbi:hypothetical protein [Mesorhizobium sp. M1342]|uniref:hypothetical protein n=1 Tax=Mesorhizobium sp. M1342 TaxID=2957088 RepID=UPI00333C158F